MTTGKSAQDFLEASAQNASPPAQIGQAAIEGVAANSALALRIGQSLVEGMAVNATSAGRAGQAFLEIVVANPGTPYVPVPIRRPQPGAEDDDPPQAARYLSIERTAIAGARVLVPATMPARRETLDAPDDGAPWALWRAWRPSAPVPWATAYVPASAHRRPPGGLFEPPQWQRWRALTPIGQVAFAPAPWGRPRWDDAVDEHPWRQYRTRLQIWNAGARVAQSIVEAIAADVIAGARVGQAFAEGAAANPSPPLDIGQLVAEALAADPAPPTHVSQLLTEALAADPTLATWIGQTYVEIVGVAALPPAPVMAVFPDLPGLAFPVVKRPVYATSDVSAPGSGRSIRAQFADWPVWEWELSYAALPDGPAAGLSSGDMKTLAGFYLARQGAYAPFLFRDPNFNAVTGQVVFTGTGHISCFVLSVISGLANDSIAEPIGYLDLSQPFALYQDGVLIPPTSYQIDTAYPHRQAVTFGPHAPIPTAGSVITADMAFFYVVRFKDDACDFEKFMDRLWAQKKLTLTSLT